jgi:hypothetical protein
MGHLAAATQFKRTFSTTKVTKDTKGASRRSNHRWLVFVELRSRRHGVLVSFVTFVVEAFDRTARL